MALSLPYNEMVLHAIQQASSGEGKQAKQAAAIYCQFSSAYLVDQAGQKSPLGSSSLPEEEQDEMDEEEDLELLTFDLRFILQPSLSRTEGNLLRSDLFLRVSAGQCVA